ncbi:MAG: hypothetical protein WAZ77_01020 [Candidatus Nitrosopolaris sp.]
MSNDIVASIEGMGKSVDEFRNSLLADIRASQYIDSETKRLLVIFVDASFNTMFRLFSLTAYNTETIYNLKDALERLPSSRESDDLKKTFRNAVKVNESQRDFIVKATRYFDDMKKDVEKT